MGPLISVIIPTHNRAAMCREAAQSVLKQSYRALEVIVVDDGSTDDTAARLLDLNLRYIRQENAGPSRARNRGLAEAKGDWICFLDSDDLWTRRKLEFQVPFTLEGNFKISFTNERWSMNGRHMNPHKKHAKYGGQIFHQCLSLCLISPSSVMIHRSVFESLGQWDENMWMCEDYELWLRFADRFPFGFLDKKLLIKRGGHAGQLSKAFFPIEPHRIEALEKLISSGQLQPGHHEAALAALKRKCEIYTKGCIKRNRANEIARIDALLKKLA